ncbi:MAG: hypothetical protein H8M99_06515 [Gloeobacteraceae cyanobacterium ES-bin-144]|nr:hypothetical protein [Verrucomicrobiales bacterium]
MESIISVISLASPPLNSAERCRVFRNCHSGKRNRHFSQCNRHTPEPKSSVVREDDIGYGFIGTLQKLKFEYR